jgi:hypothetical protein
MEKRINRPTDPIKRDDQLKKAVDEVGLVRATTGEGWERNADGIVTHNGHMNNATVAVEKGLENLRRAEDYAHEHPYNSSAQARARHIRKNLPKFR